MDTVHYCSLLVRDVRYGIPGAPGNKSYKFKAMQKRLHPWALFALLKQKRIHCTSVVK